MTAAHVIQRPLRGSRISTFYPVKSLPSLSSLDSAFQLQEYISLLIRLDVHDVDSIVSLPGTSKKDREVAREKEGTEGSKDDDKDGDRKNEIQVDQACWIYEQLRRLAQDLSHPLITTLQQECTRVTCPEMKAGEWLYLCVAHGNDGAMEQCCAIDYILHTVDSATALLNSPRTFPSRLQIPQTSHRHFSSLARRLGRIFAHAYFSHREIFEQAEAESSLYARFLALTSTFDLVPTEFLVIPSNQDGNDKERDPAHDAQQYTRQPAESPGRVILAPKFQTQHDVGISGSKSPIVAQDSLSTETGTGEHPIASNNARSRFGRNRTDTMVFADIEASGVADELAAKARAGEFDVGYETETPSTAKPEGQVMAIEESGDIELEPEAQFEILLDPGEVILAPSEPEIAHEGVAEVELEGEGIPEDNGIPTGDSFNRIDSATMDEHIQATLSAEEEGEEEEEIAEALDAETESPQVLEPEENDMTTTEDVADQTITEPAALPSSTVVEEAANTRPSAPGHESSELEPSGATKVLEEPGSELAIELELDHFDTNQSSSTDVILDDAIVGTPEVPPSAT